MRKNLSPHIRQETIEKEMWNRQDKYKTQNQIDLNLNVSVLIMNVNGLKLQFKVHNNQIEFYKKLHAVYN